MNKDNAKDFLPLVQALAEGKVIQLATTTGEWHDHLEPDFSLLPQEYRIKPEPREIWVNRWAAGGSIICETEEQALDHARRYGLGEVTRRYREVIE